MKSWKLQKVTHKYKHCIHSHSISLLFFFFLVGLTVPVFPGVLAAAGAEGKRGSRDVQILDQVTESVHNSEGHLPTLSQKVMQRHECWLSVSNAQTKPVIRRDPPQCTCKAPLHTLKKPELQSMGRALFVWMWQVRQNQDEPLSRSSSEDIHAVSSAQQNRGEGKLVQSWHKPKKQPKKNPNAESL